MSYTAKTQNASYVPISSVTGEEQQGGGPSSCRGHSPANQHHPRGPHSPRENLPFPTHAPETTVLTVGGSSRAKSSQLDTVGSRQAGWGPNKMERLGEKSIRTPLLFRSAWHPARASATSRCRERSLPVCSNDSLFSTPLPSLVQLHLSSSEGGRKPSRHCPDAGAAGPGAGTSCVHMYRKPPILAPYSFSKLLVYLVSNFPLRSCVLIQGNICASRILVQCCTVCCLNSI